MITRILRSRLRSSRVPRFQARYQSTKPNEEFVKDESEKEENKNMNIQTKEQAGRLMRNLKDYVPPLALNEESSLTEENWKRV